MTIIWICGCGDFFAAKPVEIQTREILTELEQVRENPHTKNPLPDIYRAPPKRIKVKDGVKLFYFTQHHSVDKLTALINNQFSTMRTDDQGKTTYAPYYSIGENPATNQLIVHCSSEQECDKVLEFLDMVDVPPIQVNIDCLIIERFADVTMDWETSIEIDNLFGEKITLGGKEGPEFPGASLREPTRSTFGLELGYWNQELEPHEFRAVVDMLVSRGYLKILMNPTIETINGQKGTVKARDFAPIERIVSQKEGLTGVLPYSLTDFQWVEDSLEVTPHVFADGSIGLNTKVTLGSRSKPEGVVQTSIITERTIEIAENRIKPGDSLVIGGIRKSEQRAVIRGVPFLKDIPVLGILFSSKDAEEKATEVVFILTPSISSGGIEYAKMIEDVKRKMAPPEYEIGLSEMLTDPFSSTIYTGMVEEQAIQAEFERLRAEIEKAEAQEEVDIVKEKLFETAEQILSQKAQAAKTRLETQKARQEAERVKAEAEKAKVEAEQARAKAEKARVKLEEVIKGGEKVEIRNPD
ncbi:MAG: hypothetical protein ACYSR8_04630 [Planctomycetota bacterium]